MGEEAGSTVYDQMHATVDAYNVPVNRSFYYPMFCEVVAEVKRRKLRSVLEVGCGSGGLAALIRERTKAVYSGFDFSPVGVAKARQRTGSDTFFVADAAAPESYSGTFDGIICTEVLEHISNDLGVVKLWPKGAVCVCSVPNFDYPTHVRHFLHEEEVYARYSTVINIERITRIARPLFIGKTVRGYFRDLRWARDHPKKMFGMMGIKTFDWYAGWFVFSGVLR